MERTDTNVDEAILSIAQLIGQQVSLAPDEALAQRKLAYTLAKGADWKHFYRHYEAAYASMS